MLPSKVNEKTQHKLFAKPLRLFWQYFKTGKASFIRRFDFFINKKSKRICVFDKSSKRTFNADSYFQFF